MPADVIKKVQKNTHAEVIKAKITGRKPVDVKHLQNLLGKQTISAVLTVFIFASAIFLVAMTGCRPNEACYIVLNKSVQPSNMWVRDSAHKWVATVPAEFTKTDIPYSWLVEPAEEWLVKAIKKTPNCGYNNPAAMK